MKKALFPGSFDPPTLGHLDIIERASYICDELYIGIADNINKEEYFTVKEKKFMLGQITKHLSNVKIVHFSGLVVDYVKRHEIDFIIRGLRAFSDFEHEFRMGLANRRLEEIETIFLMADQNLTHISSTLIREIAGYRRRLLDFVPSEIEELIYDRFSHHSA